MFQHAADFYGQIYLRLTSQSSSNGVAVDFSRRYIFGGFDGKTRFQDVQELDMETSAWTSIPQSENQPMGRSAPDFASQWPSDSHVENDVRRIRVCKTLASYLYHASGSC